MHKKTAHSIIDTDNENDNDDHDEVLDVLLENSVDMIDQANVGLQTAKQISLIIETLLRISTCFRKLLTSKMVKLRSQIAFQKMRPKYCLSKIQVN